MISVLMIQKVVEFERNLQMEEEGRRNRRPDISAELLETNTKHEKKQPAENQRLVATFRGRQADCAGC